MKEVYVTKFDESYLKVNADLETTQQIWSEFSFYADGYQFQEKFKNGWWDGKIRVFDTSTGLLYIGLFHHLKQFCESMEYALHVDSGAEEEFKAEFDTGKVDEFINSIPVYSGGSPIYPRDEQVLAVKRSIELQKKFNICPTSFGKSLCIFYETMYNIRRRRAKVLIVLNSSLLLTQMRDDMLDYATNEHGVNTVPETEKIGMLGGTHKHKDPLFMDNPIVCCTWQSLKNRGEDFYNRFDSIIIDEAHGAQAPVLRTILEKCGKVKYRSGWSGTLPQDGNTKYVICGLIGQPKKVITTKELMDMGRIAQLDLKFLILKYPEFHVKEMKGTKYPTETKFCEEYPNRTQFLSTLAKLQKNNQLVLFSKIKHGTALMKQYIKDMPDKTIWMIHGGTIYKNGKKLPTKTEFNADIKPIIETTNNNVIIAIYQIFSTGVSIKNIHSLVLASTTKSLIRTLQSIGRGLRKSETKHKVVVYDIVDDLTTKYKSGQKKGRVKHRNHSYKHFEHRFYIYVDEEFDYEMHTYNI